MQISDFGCQLSDVLPLFDEKGYNAKGDIGSCHFGKHALLKEEERCNQRVMPNCGGVPSTHFFFLRWRRPCPPSIISEQCPRGLSLLGLPGLDSETLVSALPAPGR